MSAEILIESQWNLKGKWIYRRVDAGRILIESQWNLKETAGADTEGTRTDINRITVEFKGERAGNV